MTITDLKGLDNDSLFDLIRTVVSYRLIGLTPSSVAYNSEVSEQAVKRILQRTGKIQTDSCGRPRWKGSYSITTAKHLWLALPPYIPLWIEKAGPIQNMTAWGMITRNTPVGWSKDPPFHRHQGAQFETPPLDSWAD